MRISDSSSDMCSSDLKAVRVAGAHVHRFPLRSLISGSTRESSVFTFIIICYVKHPVSDEARRGDRGEGDGHATAKFRSEEHTSELQSLMRISYAVFCLKKKT